MLRTRLVNIALWKSSVALSSYEMFAATASLKGGLVFILWWTLAWGSTRRKSLTTSYHSAASRRCCSRALKDEAQLGVLKDRTPAGYFNFAYSALATFRHLSKCVKLFFRFLSTDIRNVPIVTTLEMSPFRRKGNVRFCSILVNLP